MEELEGILLATNDITYDIEPEPIHANQIATEKAEASCLLYQPKNPEVNAKVGNKENDNESSESNRGMFFLSILCYLLIVVLSLKILFWILSNVKSSAVRKMQGNC